MTQFASMRLAVSERLEAHLSLSMRFLCECLVASLARPALEESRGLGVFLRLIEVLLYHALKSFQAFMATVGVADAFCIVVAAQH